MTVHGCVRVQNEQDQLVYAAGLVQENVAIHNGGTGLVRISIFVLSGRAAEPRASPF